MAKVIYICSAGHSGSTLLDLLIGSHSKVTSLGEISQLPKNLSLNTSCTCGKKVRECDLWSEVLHRMEKQIDMSKKRYPYSLNLGYFSARVVIDHAHQNLIHKFKKELELGLWYAKLRFGIPIPDFLIFNVLEGAKNSFLLYKYVSELKGTKCVVDSSKSYLKAISLYKKRPGQVKIILLLRDGRGVFYSGRKRSFSRTESLDAWKKYYTRAVPLLDRHVMRKDIMRVRYEELTESPSIVLEKICHFLGLTFEENMLDFSTKVHHLTNGNNMRFRSSVIKFDQSWIKSMQASDLEYFESHAGGLNRKLGYK